MLLGVSIADEPHLPADLERDARPLDADQLRIAHALRDAARIVGRAALPAEYRACAFGLVAELELDGALERELPAAA